MSGPLGVVATCFNGGRDLAVADRRPACRGSSAPAGLQWGRDLAVADSRSAMPTQTPLRTSFNGAATWRSRIATGYADAELPGACFNGAATWRSRIVPCRGLAWSSCLRLQWGRDLAVADRTE